MLPNKAMLPQEPQEPQSVNIQHLFIAKLQIFRNSADQPTIKHW